MTENEIATEIVDVAFKIHTRFGPGLLESAYEAIMVHELTKRGLHVVAQQPIMLNYEGIRIEVAFKADLIVEDKVIVELKSLEKLATVHSRQLLTYLRVTNLRLGLLINFGVPQIKLGIIRIANGLREQL